MIKSFSDIPEPHKPVPFGPADWRALDQLARSVKECDLVGIGAGEDDEPLAIEAMRVRQLQDVMSTILQAVRKGQLAKAMQCATALVRQRGLKFKYANPYALLCEGAWNWRRPDAHDGGIILQFATNKMVKPAELESFIEEHGGMARCVKEARTYLSLDARFAGDPMGPISRLTVNLPEGTDLRSLKECQDHVVLVVKLNSDHSSAGEAILVSGEPLLKKLMQRLDRGRAPRC